MQFRIKKNLFYILFISSIFVLISCSKNESDPVKTSSLYAVLKVESDTSGNVTCSAVFTKGPDGDNYALDLEDEVLCNGTQMTKNTSGLEVKFEGATTGSPGDEIELTLARKYHSAVTAYATLPPLITGTLTENSSHTKGANLEAPWNLDGSPDSLMTVNLTFTSGFDSIVLVQTAEASIRRVGYTAAQTDFSPTRSGSYNGTVTYKRSVEGEMPAGLEGTIEGIQTKVVNITLN